MAAQFCCQMICRRRIKSSCSIAVTGDLFVGAWWQPKRNFIQPSEFIVGPENKILHASYSSGPIARTLADDVINLLAYVSARSK